MFPLLAADHPHRLRRQGPVSPAVGPVPFFIAGHTRSTAFTPRRAYVPRAGIIQPPVLYGTGVFGPLVYWSIAPLRARSEHPVRGVLRVRD